MGLDVMVVSLVNSAEFADAALARGVRFLGKRDRWSLPLLVHGLRRLLRDDDVVMSYNWYPHLVTYLSGARVRIARYGNAPRADGVIGVRAGLMRLAHRGLAAVIGCSYGVVREAVGFGSPSVVCAGIPNAVGIPTPRSHPPHPRPYVVAAGRLHRLKGFDTLIRAYASSRTANEYDLVILGEGEERAHLETLIEDLNIGDRVLMPGHVDNIQDWLAHACLLAHTSVSEGFGNVIIEAMSLGTPVVVTDAPFGPREILARVPAGLIVPVGDVSGIASAIDTLVFDDRLHSQLSRLGLERASEAFSLERVTHAYLEVIEAVCREAGL